MVLAEPVVRHAVTEEPAALTIVFLPFFIHEVLTLHSCNSQEARVLTCSASASDITWYVESMLDSGFLSFPNVLFLSQDPT